MRKHIHYRANGFDPNKIRENKDIVKKYKSQAKHIAEHMEHIVEERIMGHNQKLQKRYPIFINKE